MRLRCPERLTLVDLIVAQDAAKVAAYERVRHGSLGEI